MQAPVDDRAELVNDVDVMKPLGQTVNVLLSLVYCFAPVCSSHCFLFTKLDVLCRVQ